MDEPTGAAIWASEELRDAQLGDARRTARLIQLVAAFTEGPGQSIPQALVDRPGAVKAAYRFFDNSEVEPEEILAAHARATRRRCADRDLVLIAQDTTQFDFSTHHHVRGVGPTGAKGLQGFFLHAALAMTVEGIPLGLLATHLWHRGPGGKAPAPKESRRWVDTLGASTAQLPASTRTLTIADREADFYEFLLAAHDGRHQFLIRAVHDRQVRDANGPLLATLQEHRPLGSIRLALPRTHGRPARRADLVVHAAQVQLVPPRHHRGGRTLSVTAILAQERRPPAGQQPVSWLLLTSLPVRTLAEASQCLRWYTLRWRIERFHYVLKSGCRTEQLQLESDERLCRALAVFCVVAWRLTHLDYVAREAPDAPCSCFLMTDEWQALYCRIQGTPTPPSEPPDVRTAVRWIARLGGFLGRRGDGEPGVKVLWLGLQALQEDVHMWRIFHPPGRRRRLTN